MSGIFTLVALMFVVVFALGVLRTLSDREEAQQTMMVSPRTVPPLGPPVDPPLSDAARSSLDADITLFGDELRDLDLDVVGYELDGEARTKYTEALDAYENAKQAMAIARLSSDAAAVAHILEEGRYAMACVRAGARGDEMPERRPPCFFDPSHGPSARNVMWTPDGGTPREVPACALDAARVSSGSTPHIRMVQQGYQAVPYWQDQGHAAYARGYYQPYVNNPLSSGLVKGALMIGGMSLLMGFLDD